MPYLQYMAVPKGMREIIFILTNKSVNLYCFEGDFAAITISFTTDFASCATMLSPSLGSGFLHGSNVLRMVLEDGYEIILDMNKMFNRCLVHPMPTAIEYTLSRI